MHIEEKNGRSILNYVTPMINLPKTDINSQYLTFMRHIPEKLSKLQ